MNVIRSVHQALLVSHLTYYKFTKGILLKVELYISTRYLLMCHKINVSDRAVTAGYLWLKPPPRLDSCETSACVCL